MIVTIKSPSLGQMKTALFEAMKMGLEYEAFPDNSFNLTVHSQDNADRIANACSGKIVAVVDRQPILSYSLVDEG